MDIDSDTLTPVQTVELSPVPTVQPGATVADVVALVAEIENKAEGRGSLREAKELLSQGYHINRVVEKTGWGAGHFRGLTDKDGYGR